MTGISKGSSSAAATATMAVPIRIDIPNGIEFELAEIGSATTKTIAASIPLDLNDTYGQFNVLRHSGSGVVH